MMAPRPRVVLDRAALGLVMDAAAEGMLDLAARMGGAAAANAPDAAPFGEGLVQHVGAAVWRGGRKAGEWSSGGGTVERPPDLEDGGRDAAVGAVGASFPGRFQETGTARQPARPWMTPAVEPVLGEAEAAFAAAAARRLADGPGG